MKPLRDLLFAGFFLLTLALVRTLTLLLRLTRFKTFVRRRLRPSATAKRRVLWLEVFFPENAGYHYRSFKWKQILDEHGFDAQIKTTSSKKEFESIHKQDQVTRFYAVSLLRRIRHCLQTINYDCVIVRRELLHFNDYGNLFLEKFLLALHPNVVLDFDDDIAAAKREPKKISAYGKLLHESPAKFTHSLRLYNRFIVGSNYLKQLVQERSPGVRDEDILVIPTCVDYAKYPRKSYDRLDDCLNFGWVGSNGNLKFLDIVLPALENLSRRYPLRLLVISGKEYRPDVSFEVENIPWSLEGEIDNLRRIDVGIMPLHDTPVERGKCGFKLIQYMGLGIVSVASAVTINKEIVDDKINGFLVNSPAEWENVLNEVLERRGDYDEIGAAAWQTIRSRFSYEGNREAYLEFVGELR